LLSFLLSKHLCFRIATVESSTRHFAQITGLIGRPGFLFGSMSELYGIYYFVASIIFG
jgi:hypothetical protein